MAKLPVINGRQAIKVLEKFGFQVNRVKGSHHIMVKEDFPNHLTVPVHTKDLKRGTLKGIIRDAGITVDEFCDKLR